METEDLINLGLATDTVSTVSDASSTVQTVSDIPTITEQIPTNEGQTTGIQTSLASYSEPSSTSGLSLTERLMFYQTVFLFFIGIILFIDLIRRAVARYRGR